jgi:hypothetical protein
MNDTYEDLKKRLNKDIFLRDKVDDIHKRLVDGKIDKTTAFMYLTKLDQGLGIDLTSIDSKEWDELVSVIDESEHRLKKSIKYQLIIALFEIPLFIVFIIVLLKFEFFQSIVSEFTILAVAILGSLLTHSFFILRIYQQGLTAIERFSEKRVGLMFLKIAANPNNKGNNNDFLINAGTEMFLGHHVKPAEPLNANDLPKK